MTLTVFELMVAVRKLAIEAMVAAEKMDRFKDLDVCRYLVIRPGLASKAKAKRRRRPHITRARKQ